MGSNLPGKLWLPKTHKNYKGEPPHNSVIRITLITRKHFWYPDYDFPMA